jgi:hypothetical protein
MAQRSGERHLHAMEVSRCRAARREEKAAYPRCHTVIAAKDLRQLHDEQNSFVPLLSSGMARC